MMQPVLNLIKGDYQMSAPKRTANELVDEHFVTTHTTTSNIDLGSSDGIRRAVEACVRAIKSLANHIDGTGPGGVPEATTGVRTTTDPATGALVYTDIATGKRTDKAGKPL
jgi:hypothetical protein